MEQKQSRDRSVCGLNHKLLETKNLKWSFFLNKVLILKQLKIYRTNGKTVQSLRKHPYPVSLFLTSYVRKVYLLQPLMFFFVPKPLSGHHVKFAYVTLGSSLLWQFLRLPLLLMTLPVLRITGEVLRSMSLRWDLLMFFSWLEWCNVFLEAHRFQNC